MSDKHSSTPPRSRAEGSEVGVASGSSDDAATLSYTAFEPSMNPTQELAVGHTALEWTAAEAVQMSAQRTATHSLPSLLSGPDENRQAVPTQPLIPPANSVVWHASDHSISQGSTLTATSKEYLSSSDISQRSQASILHNIHYHSPLEQLQQRRGQPLIIPASRPELVPETSSVSTWSDPEHTPEFPRHAPAEAFWSTRGHFSSSSESNMSPPSITSRQLGREISGLSNISSLSHQSTERENDTTTSSSRHSHASSGQHVVQSSQGSYAQESYEDHAREEAPETPTVVRRTMYVQGTFIEENVTPEMLKHSDEDIVWSSSPSQRAAARHRQSQSSQPEPESPLKRTAQRKRGGQAAYTPMSLRTSPRNRRRHYKILFTGLENGPSLTRDKSLVDHLGGLLVDDWQECSHLVTEELRTTIRCLCAVAACKPVVSVDWIQACRTESRFIDETPYLIRPIPSHPVFQGKRLFQADKGELSKSDFRELVTAGGGKVLHQEPSEHYDDVLIFGIPSQHDKQHMRLKALRYSIYTKSELIRMILAL
ncbi:hypothetical protein BC943DRAFT_18101 [Umbelopsis sp. AD052]|nr:hypothetical protein BC943DRAFT_18101 [Umbelopsis sp. AD052]